MTSGVPGSRSPCGSYVTYRNHGCRCEACTEAWRVYHMDYRRRKGIRPEAQYRAESIRHGPVRYRKGCRCDVCRAAMARQKREQRARNPEYDQRALAKLRAKRAP